MLAKRKINAPTRNQTRHLMTEMSQPVCININIVIWQLKGPNNGGRRNCLLPGNGSINVYHGNGYTYNNRGTAVFSMQSMPRLYSKNHWEKLASASQDNEL
jgi:hypothetical protein